MELTEETAGYLLGQQNSSELHPKLLT